MTTALSPPAPTPTAAVPPTPRPLTVLVQLLHRLLDFRDADTEAAAALAGLPPVGLRPAHAADDAGAPFRLADLPAAGDAGRLLERAMLVKTIIDVWGEGPTLAAAVAAALASGAAARVAALGAAPAWRATVDGYGIVTTPTTTTAALADARLLTSLFRGPVSLTAPDVVLRILIVGGRASEGGDKGTLPFAAPRVVVGLELGHGRAPARAAMAAQALAARPYIGPTSMDPEVALIMANLAFVRPGSLVLDPCAGTGSILLAAAARGGRVVGCDIDAAALWGRPAARAARKWRDGGIDAAAVAATGARVTAKGGARYAPGPAGAAAAAAAAQGAPAGIADNFVAAGLAPAGFLVADMGGLPLTRGPARGGLDAIIADPPYGVRAGGRTQTGAAAAAAATAPNERARAPTRGGARFRAGGAPAPTAAYALGACLGDLLSASARALRLGGRLVFFLPTAAGPVPPAHLPSHPALTLIVDCEQPLSRWYSRRLIVMEKSAPYDAAAEAAAAAAGVNAAAFEAASAVASGVYGAYAEGGSGCVRKGRSKQT